MKMMVLVHPQLGLRCGAALPGAFFSEKHHFLEKALLFVIFQLFFAKKDLIYY